MIETATNYVTQTPEGGWRLTGSRVSLDSIVYLYQEGRSPEAIVDEFPSLTLEQVRGAIAFYLRHQQEIDLYLHAQGTRWQDLEQASEQTNAPLLERIRKKRQTSPGDKGSS